MPKRMTDTNLWDKIWFRKLKPSYKCFWFYIKDRCSYAGIWEVDLETAEYFIGSKLEADEVLKVFDRHILKINDNKWYLIDFIKFQYNCEINELNPDSSVHKGIIKEIEKYNIVTLIEGLDNPLVRTKDKDMVKDIVKDKDKEKRVFIPPTLQELKEYININHYSVDADRFIDFYQSKGWMIGKNKMKDWRAAVRTWAKGDKNAINKRNSKEVTPDRIASDLEKAFSQSRTVT